MSKSVEETRRELFESQLITEHPGAVMLLSKKSSGSYHNGYVQSRWDGFNAALDAVEIELPNVRFNEYITHNEAACIGEGIASCTIAIKKLNLGLKIK